MHSTVTKGGKKNKQRRIWEKGSLSLVTGSVFKLSLDLSNLVGTTLWNVITGLLLQVESSFFILHFPH